MNSSDEDLRRIRSELQPQIDDTRSLVERLLDASRPPPGYTLSREAAEAVERLPDKIKEIRREVESLKTQVGALEGFVAKLEVRVSNKREELYGGPGKRGLVPRVDALEERTAGTEKKADDLRDTVLRWVYGALGIFAALTVLALLAKAIGHG